MHLKPQQQKPLNELTGPQPDRATFFDVQEDDEGQRLDNFLVKVCKGVPKSHLYRIIRAGELRVNKKRVDAQYKLVRNDLIRIPPIRVASRSLDSSKVYVPFLELPVLFEDEGMLVVDKPAGLAVHGGSGIDHGVVERLRATIHPQGAFLELVHRLDRETSGVLVLAKKRIFLKGLQDQVRARSWKKFYNCLVMGQWNPTNTEVNLALHKTTNDQGERRVYVHPQGTASTTKFRILKTYHHDLLGTSSLLEAQLITGRTHQIRVHCQAKGCAIAGDDKYGQFAINRMWTRAGLNRMFLHAARLELSHPISGETLCFEASLPQSLKKFLEGLPFHDV